MENLNEQLQSILTTLENAYNAKTKSPEWFNDLTKTLHSKNITLEDWNTLNYYLSNVVSDDISFYNFCNDLISNLEISNNILNETFNNVKSLETELDDVKSALTRIDDLENDKLDKQLGISGTNIVYSATMESQTTTFLDNNSNTFRFNAIPIRDGYGRLHNSNYIHKGAETELPTSVAITKGYADENYGEKEIVDRLQQRVKQLELASEGTILQTIYDDKEVSYNRVISEYALPNAMLEKVSGMTYKSENILNIDDFSATSNGITYTYSKGHFTIKGTFESVQHYNQVYFNNKNTHITGKTKIEANKTCILCISKPVNRPIFMAQSGVGATGKIEIGNVTKVFSNTKEVILNCIGIGSSTEEDVGTSVDLEFDIWVNEGTTAKPFNVYYEGLRDTKVTEVVSNGANLISSEFVFGSFDNTTGVFNQGTTAGTTIVTKDYIKVLPNTTYTFSINENKTCYFGEYDKDYNYLGLSNGNKSKTITTKSNTAFLRLKIWDSAGTTLENATNRMLNYGSEALPYVPYKAPITYSIPSQVKALEGYGIGINGDYNNYIDYDRKVFVKACDTLALNVSAPTNIQLNEGGYIFATYLVNGMADAPIDDLVCDKINVGVRTSVELRTRASYTNNIYIYIPYGFLSATPTTKEEAKTLVLEYFNSIGLTTVNYIYPLATPIETDISQYLTDDNVIEVEENGTLTFENEHQQEVMNLITYQERII